MQFAEAVIRESLQNVRGRDAIGDARFDDYAGANLPACEVAKTAERRSSIHEVSERSRQMRKVKALLSDVLF